LSFVRASILDWFELWTDPVQTFFMKNCHTPNASLKEKGGNWTEERVEDHNVLNNPEEWLKHILFPRRFINKHDCLYTINNT